MEGNREIYVIERCIAPGVWELVCDIYFIDRNIAVCEKSNYVKGMKDFKNEEVVARVSKLKLNNVEDI